MHPSRISRGDRLEEKVSSTLRSDAWVWADHRGGLVGVSEAELQEKHYGKETQQAASLAVPQQAEQRGDGAGQAARLTAF